MQLVAERCRAAVTREGSRNHRHHHYISMDQSAEKESEHQDITEELRLYAQLVIASVPRQKAVVSIEAGCLVPLSAQADKGQRERTESGKDCIRFNLRGDST